MKFTMHAAVFADAIAAAISSLPTKPTVAILGGVLIEAFDDSVSFSSYNYDRSTVRAVPADVAEKAVAVVSGRLLSVVGGNLPKNTNATVTVSGSSLVIAAGRTEFQLPLMIAEDYPGLPVMSVEDSIGTVDCRAFTDAVKTIGAFAATDPTPANLTSLNIDCAPGMLTVCATDRYIVGRRHLPWSGEVHANINVTASDLLATIKAVAATETEDLEILWDEKRLGLRTKSTTVVTSVLAEDFPPIDPILNTDTYYAAITVPTVQLAGMLKRAMSIADDHLTQVDVAVTSGELSVSTTKSGTGNIVDAIEAVHHGADRRLALSSKRMHAALAAIQHADVTLAFRETGDRLSHLVTLYPGGINFDGTIVPPDTDTVAALIGIAGVR